MKAIAPLIVFALAACSRDDPVPPTPSPTPVATAAPAPAPRAPVAAVDSQRAPVSAPVRVFRDWAVACDNGGLCEAVSLAPGESQLADFGLLIRREAGGAAAPTVRLRSTRGAAGAVTIAVDGRDAARGTIDGDGALDLSAADARRLIGAVVNGSRAEVRGAGAASPISLTGASAALRYMDAEQGRAGTSSGLVARGLGVAPAAPTLPTVVAAPIAGRQAAAPDPALVARMRADTNCVADECSPATAAAHPLSDTQTLVLLSCGAGAYNMIAVPLIVTGADFVDAPFDETPTFGEDDGRAALVNADWDAATATLSTRAKGRGLGDCGTAQNFVWDGTRFRLTRMQTMPDCRGAIAWPTVWRAQVVRR